MVCLIAFAQAPRFIGPTYVLDGGVPIDVGYYGSPFMYDWDGDGKKDLIVGQFTYGYIRFYRNIGTDPEPLFSGYEFLYASGSQITLPSG
uniref:VCBS repeat-containing protein n=1 Tax=candidate division WOR-3 bacterium TaxID=2052148 RepID=A0A7C6EBY6_UNCW3